MPKKPANRKYVEPKKDKGNATKLFAKSGNHLIKQRIGMISYCDLSLEGWWYDDNPTVICNPCTIAFSEVRDGG